MAGHLNAGSGEQTNQESGTGRGLPGRFWKVALGAVFASAVFSQTFSFISSTWGQVVLLVLLWISATLTAGWLIEQWLIPGLQTFRPSQRWLWLGICFLSGFLLIFLIPITVYPAVQTIQLTAMGEKNPLAQSSQVWLQGISAGDYDSPAFLRSCEGDWIRQDHSLVSLEDRQPSVLTCRVRSDDSLTIRIGMHPWSGLVRLEYAGLRVEEDLYSAGSQSAEFTFEVPLSKTGQTIWWLFFLAIGISLGASLAALLLFLVRHPSQPVSESKLKPLPWFAYAGLVIAIWLVFLLAFWPGFFSNDVFNQFKQIESGEYNDWHPIFHTLFLLFTTRLAFSPAPAIVLQIVSLGSLIGWALASLEKAGLPRGLALAAALYLAFSPAVGLTILNPWKDLAYAISISALAILIFELARRRDTGNLKFWSTLALMAVSLLVALFRHNGPPVAAGTLVYLMLADRPRWKSYGAVLLSAALIWAFVRGPVYNLLPHGSILERESGENLVPLSEAIYLSRLHLRSGTSIRPEDQELLAILTDERGKTDTVLLRKNASRVFQIALQATLEQPSVTLRYFMRKASFVFQILRPPGSRFGYVGMSFVKNPYGIELNSKIPGLMPWLVRLKSLTESPEIDWFIWRNGFWMYLLLLAGITASIRLKSWIYLGPAIPAILNALPYMLVGSQQGRYILPTIILGPLFGLCLLFVRREPQDDCDPFLDDGMKSETD